MNIYTAGWALQSPALNFFKHFLRLNSNIKISGIIYPNKIPDDVDGIPILDFDSACNIITSADVVLNCYRPGIPNDHISRQFQEFFKEKGIALTSVMDFVSALVHKDSKNELRFPIEGVTSRDIVELQKMLPLSDVLADGMFADLESSSIARKLDSIAREVDWDKMLAFDQDETPESTLLEVLLWLQKYEHPMHFHVLDTPHIFMNTLLKIKALHPAAMLRVEVSPSVVDELGMRFEFFQRTLNIVVTQTIPNATLLSGSAQSICELLRSGKDVVPAIFFMRRSIFDCRDMLPLLENRRHRILLRQPDTIPENLISVLLN